MEFLERNSVEFRTSDRALTIRAGLKGRVFRVLTAGLEVCHYQSVAYSESVVAGFWISLATPSWDSSSEVHLFLNTRGFRWIAAALLVAQVSLLWISATHLHASGDIPGHKAPSVEETAPASQQAPDRLLICPVCQIIRNGTALPTAGSPPAQLLTASALRLIVFVRSPRSGQPLITCGRSPPLA